MITYSGNYYFSAEEILNHLLGVDITGWYSSAEEKTKIDGYFDKHGKYPFGIDQIRKYLRQIENEEFKNTRSPYIKDVRFRQNEHGAPTKMYSDYYVSEVIYRTSNALQSKIEMGQNYHYYRQKALSMLSITRTDLSKKADEYELFSDNIDKYNAWIYSKFRMATKNLNISFGLENTDYLDPLKSDLANLKHGYAEINEILKNSSISSNQKLKMIQSITDTYR